MSGSWLVGCRAGRAETAIDCGDMGVSTRSAHYALRNTNTQQECAQCPRPARFAPPTGALHVLFVKTRNTNGTDTVAYFHHDHLGTPMQATDKQGNVVWAASYNVFGRADITTPAATADKPTITVNLRLPGQYFDEETGLHQNWHRYYDAALGRYMTQDPVGLAVGPNAYVYAHGNPLSAIDPEGLWSFQISAYVPVLGPIGPGGALIFGTNPNGTGFMTGRLGIGMGGGLKIDPNGKRPGYDESAGCGWGAGMGVYGGWDFNAGPIYGQSNAARGVNSSPSGPRFYSQRGLATGGRGRIKGIGMTVAAGTQFTVFGGGPRGGNGDVCGCNK
jgi:RHS repeat-associated protein